MHAVSGSVRNEPHADRSAAWHALVPMVAATAALSAMAALSATVTGCAGAATRGGALASSAQEPVADAGALSAAEAEVARRASIERAQSYLAIGDPEAALQEYQEAAEREPDAPSTRSLLARLHLLVGDNETAEELLAAVLADTQGVDQRDMADAHYALALLAAARGEGGDQRARLEAAIAADPSHSDALASLAAHLASEGETEPAAELFDRALDQDPDNVAALLGRGSLAAADEQPEEALGYYDRASDADPEYAFVYVDRANVLREERRYEEAIVDMTRAVELEPEYYWHYLDRGRLHVLAGDRDAASADYGRAIEIDDTVFIAYARRGNVRFRRVDPGLVLADYERAISLRPDYYPAYPFIALLNAALGDWTRAAEYFARSSEHEPQELGYLLLSGLGHLFAEDATAAAEIVEQVRTVAPRDSWYYDASRLLLGELDTLTLHTKYRDHRDQTQAARMTFYLGAAEVLAGRPATATLYFLEAQDRTEADYLERYLAQSLGDALEQGEGAGPR